MNFENICKLYEKEVPATRTGLFYNLFSYPTKISPEVIAIYIATHTHVNDTVLDAFGGSGTTAIAAKLCEYPNERMINLIKQVGLKPEWGPRKTITYELGQFGYFATNTLMNAPDAMDFSDAAKEMIEHAEQELGKHYCVKDDEGKIGEIRHVIWSDIVICPICHQEISYYDVSVKYNPFAINKVGKCPCCNNEINLEDCEHAVIEEYDELMKCYAVVKKRVPQKIYGITGKRKWSRMAKEEDKEACHFYMNDLVDEPKRIEWGDLYRSGYHQGITHLHHFYTKRNYYVMSKLWSYTAKYDEKIKNALRLLLLSYNASHSTLMTRVVAKKNSKDFVLTGAQSGVLYISSLPVEKNIIMGIKRKKDKFTEAFQLMNKCIGRAEVWNCSSTDMHQVKTGSVKYVFTDPPFGDYIPYAEINQINELWMNEKTNRKDEVIISPAQKKGLDEYEFMLSKVFGEIERILKNDGLATVVFHSSKADVWNAMCRAMERADMHVKDATILDKVQGSFKQVVESNSVKGDPIMLLSKEEQGEKKKVSFEKVVSEHLKNGEVNEQHIYSKYISNCLANQDEICLDAKDAYSLIKQMAGVL